MKCLAERNARMSDKEACKLRWEYIMSEMIFVCRSNMQGVKKSK